MTSRSPGNAADTAARRAAAYGAAAICVGGVSSRGAQLLEMKVRKASDEGLVR